MVRIHVSQPVLKNYNKKYKEYKFSIEKAEVNSTSRINPNMEIGIYFWVPDFETFRFVKKYIKETGVGVSIQNEDKRSKYIEKINKEFRDFLEVYPMNTGSPDLGDFFIELGNNPVSVFIKDFVVIKILEDVGDKVWGKIKESFSSLFKKSSNKKNIQIIIEGSDSVTTFILSKDLKSKDVDFSLDKIPGILKSHKNRNRNSAYVFNKKNNKWENKKNIILE